jgi:hypothetical protein
MMENMVNDTVVLTHGELLVLRLTVSLVVRPLRNSSLAGLRKSENRLEFTYVVLSKPLIAMYGATGE